MGRVCAASRRLPRPRARDNFAAVKRAHHPASGPAIGTATELVAGRPRPQPCYGTYAGDMPDQRFRLRIAVVEHADSFKMHAHEYSEICLVLGGHATHLTKWENHPLETGDVFVINGDTRHGFAQPQGLKLCNVMFDPRQFLSGQRDLDRMMGYHALFDLQPRAKHPKEFRERLHLAPAHLAQANQIIATMRDEFDRREDGWPTVVRGLFLQLVTHLARCYARQQKRAPTPLIRMANVVAHIQKNFREPLRMADLARVAHLSVSQFQRLFKRTYQTTPVKFIAQVRVHEACELLKDPNNDVTRVAFDCGYNSPAFFSAQFKALMGEAPSVYRRRQLAARGRPAEQLTFPPAR
jgi:AraC family L-rhamnose operon regulatory protein RhaS